MEKSNLSRLLHRYMTGEVNPQEKQKIEMLFEVMGNSHPEDLELSKEKEDKIFSLITSSEDTSKEIKALNFRHDDKGRVDRLVLRIAATVLILSIVALGVYMTRDKFGVFASSAYTKKMILTDGSLVWLRGNSNLSFYEKGADGFRHANLAGDALFEVAKDPEHPFIVKSDGLTIKVLGTSFSLKKLKTGIEVVVITGKVSVMSKRDSTLILPGEKVVFDTHALTLAKSATAPSEIPDAIDGTEYSMAFNNATLEDVAHRIEEKFDVDVKFETPGISNCHLTADYSDHSLEATLNRITDVLHVQYTIEGNEVRLTGDPCN
jgi:transmembrane sensor